MTPQEYIDDAKADAGAYGNYTSLTNKNLLRFVSEAWHELQVATKAVKSTVAVNVTDLDANGMVPLDPSITVPTRCFYTPANSTARMPVVTIGPDDMAIKKSSTLTNPPTYLYQTGRTLYVTIEQNKIIFWPYQGLSGTFTFTAYAKMPLFADSRTTDVNSFWYQWDDAHNLATKMKTVNAPQEFDDADEGITAYVAARLIESIPGWRRLFREEHEQRMLRFTASFDKVRANVPTYPANHEVCPNYGSWP